jgi:hypothetical protein
VRATHARRADGRVDVVNRCRTAEGETEARGVARIVDERTFAKLKGSPPRGCRGSRWSGETTGLSALRRTIPGRSLGTLAATICGSSPARHALTMGPPRSRGQPRGITDSTSRVSCQRHRRVPLGHDAEGAKDGVRHCQRPVGESGIGPMADPTRR